MDISPAVRERINSAADALYEESGRRNIPTVDAVRKRAKVNINDASTCMREWRNAQATKIEAPNVNIPEKLQQLTMTALQALWTEALRISDEALRLAQAEWRTERAEALALSEQIAQACTSQEAELLAAQAELARQMQEITHLSELLAASKRDANEAASSAAGLRAANSLAQATALEIGKRADDLRQALDRAHESHAAALGEQAAALRSHRDEIASLRAELEDSRHQRESEVATARAEQLKAIEEAASLRGKLDGLAEAQALRAVQPRPRRQSDGAGQAPQ